MLTVAKYTDCGSREINEDAVEVVNNGELNCFILCDGLGGHGMGDIASRHVAEVFKNRFLLTEEAVNFLGDAFTTAQQSLMAKQIEMHSKQKMKTTAVCGVTDKNKLYIGHIGDSRLYVFNHNKVVQRTLDHSIPQMLVLSKQIKESEIRFHPNRNILLRVMGIEWEEPKYELMIPIPLKKCQAILLCSDGFWELITEAEMCKLLKSSKSVEEWLQRMVDVVQENGKDKEMDNNSAIAIWRS